jgi:hypothetical protein
LTIFMKAKRMPGLRLYTVLLPFTITISVTSLKKCRNQMSLTMQTAFMIETIWIEEIVCFLATAAGVAAVQTLVARPRSDHYHAARVAGGRV